MNIEELNKLIFNRCKEKGLCNAGIEQWEGATKEQLIKMYAAEPEFIILQKPFSLYQLRDMFEKELLNKQGVYLLEDNIDLDININSKDYIFNSCNGDINIFSDDNIITISDNSELNINIKGCGLYTINVYDLSSVNIMSDSNNIILIVSYGNNNIDTANVKGKVKILNK